MADAIIIGAVGGPFGLDGWVHMKSFTAPADNLLRYRPWLHRQGEAWTPVEVEARRHRDGFVARFAGCGDRDQAIALRGSEIAMPAQALPAAAEDEYYWRDLVGCEVIAANDASRLGKVARLFDTPAHDVLVVEGEQREQWIPFVRSVVLDVDLAERRLRVDWQPL